MRSFPQEVKDFLTANVVGRTSKELAALVSAEFGLPFTEAQVKTFKSRHRLKSGIPCGGRSGPSKVYPQEVQDFIRRHYKGITTTVLAERLNDKFGTAYSREQIKSLLCNHGLRNGVVRRFEKGHVTHNKGKKGYCPPGCEKSWFKKGHTPSDHRPVGSERIDNKDGYTWVKVAEPNKWRLKHRVIWEEVRGAIPDEYILIFKDGDKGNITVDNLALVSRAEHLMLTRSNLRSTNADMTETGILIAKVKVKSHELKKSKQGKPKIQRTETADRPVAPPCHKLTLEADGVDGDNFMYSTETL
ncbi:MAG: HNH endonuclease [Oscillospiraceae bacterium]|nr:HNH endonuclease [Oscillospiraceae bacterium]